MDNIFFKPPSCSPKFTPLLFRCSWDIETPCLSSLETSKTGIVCLFPSMSNIQVENTNFIVFQALAAKPEELEILLISVTYGNVEAQR